MSIDTQHKLIFNVSVDVLDSNEEYRVSADKLKEYGIKEQYKIIFDEGNLHDCLIKARSKIKEFLNDRS